MKNIKKYEVEKHIKLLLVSIFKIRNWLYLIWYLLSIALIWETIIMHYEKNRVLNVSVFLAYVVVAVTIFALFMVLLKTAEKFLSDEKNRLILGIYAAIICLVILVIGSYRTLIDIVLSTYDESWGIEKKDYLAMFFTFSSFLVGVLGYIGTKIIDNK